MQSIKNAQIKAADRVLVRCDLDVPLENSEIGETYRLEAALPTLNYILEQQAVPVIMGHIGKPDGKLDEKLSTKHLRPYFEEKLQTRNFELLENLRFDPREEANDPGFAKELAQKANLYVNESFATSHRKHTSIVGVPKLLPHFAGLNFEKEVQTLSTLLENPERPFTVIIGGAKLESKMPVISKFLQIADFVLVGGKLGTEWKDAVPENLVLPTDYVEDQKDLGQGTMQKYTELISRAKTILWAGPLGMYEDPKFMAGTKALAEAIVKATEENDAQSVIGGGDTITATNSLGLLTKFSFVSTGGGAMLQFLSEGTLPGIEALK